MLWITDASKLCFSAGVNWIWLALLVKLRKEERELDYMVPLGRPSCAKCFQVNCVLLKCILSVVVWRCVSTVYTWSHNKLGL